MLNLIRSFEKFCLVSLFLTMVTLFSFSALAREIGGSFASQFAWIEEATRLMNTFLVFLALGLALERGRHVGINTLRDRLPAGLRLPLFRLIDLTGLVFSLYLAWLSYGLAEFVLNTGQRSPTLDIPMGYVYVAPIIGFGLLGLRYALSLFGPPDRFIAQAHEAEEP